MVLAVINVHFIGCDIHDMSDIAQGVPFAANMALAIEPAAYVSDHPLIPPRFRNMGVRIEDDVFITDGALELLSKALPRTAVLQIENLMVCAGHHAKPHIRRCALLRRQQKNESLAQLLGIDDDVLNNVDRKLELRAVVEAKHAWNRSWHPL